MQFDKIKFYPFLFYHHTVMCKVSRLQSTPLVELGLDTLTQQRYIIVEKDKIEIFCHFGPRIAKTLRAATPRVFFVHLKACAQMSYANRFAYILYHYN